MPSLEALNQRFIAAQEATLADATPEQKTGFWQNVQNNLASLVRIRKTGASHSGSDASSILARAEYALEQQEFEQLQEEIKALPQSAHVYFEELNAAIHSRQELLKTLDVIRATLTSHTQGQ